MTTLSAAKINLEVNSDKRFVEVKKTKGQLASALKKLGYILREKETYFQGLHLVDTSYVEGESSKIQAIENLEQLMSLMKKINKTTCYTFRYWPGPKKGVGLFECSGRGNPILIVMQIDKKE